jgi:hypothetical protein
MDGPVNVKLQLPQLLKVWPCEYGRDPPPRAFFRLDIFGFGSEADFDAIDYWRSDLVKDSRNVRKGRMVCHVELEGTEKC